MTVSDPSLEIQGAIIARLKGFAGVSALVSGRIYDSVPTTATFPYISWGPEQMLSDDTDCINGYEINLQLDVWSRKTGFPEAKQIADQVRRALHNYDLPLTDNALISIEHRDTRMLRDPDGLTSHGVLSFAALVEQP